MEIPKDSAVDLFRTLQALVAERSLALRFDYRRLQHIDCPVGSEADGNIWAYAVLVAALAAFGLGGLAWAIAVSAWGAVIYLTLGLGYVRRRIRRRIQENALQNLTLWQRLWRFGGISLVPADGTPPCAAPQGNWMELVRRSKTGLTAEPLARTEGAAFKPPARPGRANRWRD